MLHRRPRTQTRTRMPPPLQAAETTFAVRALQAGPRRSLLRPWRRRAALDNAEFTGLLFRSGVMRRVLGILAVMVLSLFAIPGARPASMSASISPPSACRSRPPTAKSTIGRSRPAARAIARPTASTARPGWRRTGTRANMAGRCPTPSSSAAAMPSMAPRPSARLAARPRMAASACTRPMPPSCSPWSRSMAPARPASR